PVDGIEHPDVFRVGALLAVLLADDAMIRKGPADERAHRGFGGMIGCGHGIEAAMAALVLDAERRAEERQDGLPRPRCHVLHERLRVDLRHAAPLNNATTRGSEEGRPRNPPPRLVAPAATCEVALPARARPGISGFAIEMFPTGRAGAYELAGYGLAACRQVLSY